MQLVELQRNVHEPSGGEVAVFAVSYDPVDVLAHFAGKHGIAYPLLADVGSKLITQLGLLNTQIAEERAYWGKTVEPRHRGLPYPGTFILDNDGIVVERLFERSHRLRPGGKVLLDRLGLDDDDDDAVATAHGQALSAAARVDTPEYFPNQIVRLRLRLAIEAGFHVYVPPNPSGFTDLSVAVEAPDGVFVYPHELPEGHTFSIDGFSETFNVAEGDVEIDIPFYVLEDSGDVTLHVRIDYQACNDATCLLPDTLDLSIDLHEVSA